MPSVGTDIWTSSLPMGILMTAAVLSVLLRLDDLLRIAATLPASLVRWKECVSLNSSVSLSRSRNHVAAAMILPFIVICSHFGIYPPAGRIAGSLFRTAGDTALQETAVVALVFLAYLAIRLLCRLCFKGRNIEKREYECACSSIFTFFISAVLLTFAVGGICELLSVDENTISVILRWILALVYAVAIIRKTQIFVYYRGFLAGILYLCTLEFLPTGLLIVSSVVF